MRLEAVDEFALFLKNLNDVADLVFGRVHLEGEAAESAAVSLNPVLGAHEVNNLDHVVAGPLEAFGKLCNCNESLAFVVGEVNQHAEAEVCKSCEMHRRNLFKWGMSDGWNPSDVVVL